MDFNKIMHLAMYGDVLIINFLNPVIEINALSIIIQDLSSKCCETSLLLFSVQRFRDLDLTLFSSTIFIHILAGKLYFPNQ